MTRSRSSVEAKSPSASVVVALLRGVNVGGKNMLPMADLKAMFVAARCENVRTLIQSGNVVCRTRDVAIGDLPTTISKAIAKQFGYRIPVVVRTASEIANASTHNPFLKGGIDPDELHISFLADTPEKDLVAALDNDRSPPDRFIVKGRDIYLHLPNGVARTKLTNAYFDSALRTTSTLRNWRTLLKLIELTLDDRSI